MQRLIQEFRTDIYNRLTSSLEDDDIHKLNQAVLTTVEILGKVK